MKPLRWDGLVAYVGKYEVGRVFRITIANPEPGYTNDMWVSMLDSFGHSPIGTYDENDARNNVAVVKRGKQMVEENWNRIKGLMS